MRTFSTRLVEKTEVQKEVLVKKENGTIVQKAATKKRDAMEEEVVKEEGFDDGDISRTVRRVSKRTRVKASKS